MYIFKQATSLFDQPPLADARGSVRSRDHKGAVAQTFVTLCFFALACGSLAFAQAGLTDRYCIGCHNDELHSGGLSLAHLSAAHPERNPAEWEKVIVKLRAGMMPPSGIPRPGAASIASFAASLEKALDEAAASHPNPGRPALHRLNRLEYAD